MLEGVMAGSGSGAELETWLGSGESGFPLREVVVLSVENAAVDAILRAIWPKGSSISRHCKGAELRGVRRASDVIAARVIATRRGQNTARRSVQGIPVERRW